MNTKPSRAPVIKKMTLALMIISAAALFLLYGTPARAEDQKVLSSFENFTKTWMVRLEEISQKNKRAVQLEEKEKNYSGNYVVYGPECDVWIQKTDSPETPYLGFLRYQEKSITTSGSTQEEARNNSGEIEQEIKVTEIFRFANGKWIY